MDTSPPKPPVPLPAQPLTGPDSALIAQWRTRVARLVAKGAPREEIIEIMSQSNWPYDQAQALVQKIARRQRYHAIIIIASCGLITAVAVLGMATFPRDPGNLIGLTTTTLCGFVYGIVKLTKIRA